MTGVSAIMASYGLTSFVPTVLVTENWTPGSGLVNGKTPTSGSGTWVASSSIPPSPMNYGFSEASPGNQDGNAFHSATYTNARFTGLVTSGLTGPYQNQPVYIFARGNINTAFPLNCYYIACNADTDPALENIVLYKRLSGIDTTLGTINVGTTEVNIGLEVSGSAVKVYRAGAVVISVTDTSITSAGYWGFGLTYGESGEETGNSVIGAITIQTAPFVPVTLVQEDWVSGGSGVVQNRTPSPISGSGTWQTDVSGSSAVVTFEPFYAVASTLIQSTGLFRHSVTLTNASITAIVTPSFGAADAPVPIWARSTPGPTTNPTSGYYVECSDPLSGATAIVLRKRVSGVETDLGSSSTNPTNQSVSFTVSDSTLTVKVNGTTVIQVTDSSITTAGYWGYGVAYFGDESQDTFATVGPILIQTA